MILLDTNVVIDAHNPSPYQAWARSLIPAAVLESGAVINSIILAELYAGPSEGEAIEEDMRRAGVLIVDLPAAASVICGRAYARYRDARRKSRGGNAPATPLPDFFIGAHAELMGWKLATRDSERFRLYFPDVELIEPA